MKPIQTEGKTLRILVSRADRLGDLVLSTPVFSELRKKYPSAWIACLTFLENREVIAGNPYINKVILYDKKGSERSVLGQLKFAARLASEKFDIAIHLHATNRIHLATWAARIPVRIGWDRRAPWALTHVYPDSKVEGKKHEAQYNFDLLGPLSVSCPEKLETFFPLTDRAASSLDHFLKNSDLPDIPWIALNPSASCPSKIWPAERWGYLIESLERKYKAHFILIGTRQDRQLTQKIKDSVPFPVSDLSGHLSLGMLGVFLKKCQLLISNDSGPVHVASAVGTPVVSIFGRNQPGLSPTRWRPLGENSKVVWKNVGCEPCLAHACQIHFLCLDIISTEDVLREADFFLFSNLLQAAGRSV